MKVMGLCSVGAFAPCLGSLHGSKALQLVWKSPGIRGITRGYSRWQKPRAAAWLPSACGGTNGDLAGETKILGHKVHAQGTSLCCSDPPISLSEGYHFGDAFNKGARTVTGCQKLPAAPAGSPAPTPGCAYRLLAKMKENGTFFILSSACQSQGDTLLYSSLFLRGRWGTNC